MSSTIKLYEHNQKAYDALLDMLGERDEWPSGWVNVGQKERAGR